MATGARTMLRLLRLAAPVALGRLGVVGMGVVDAVVVGRLAPHTLAHQALGWTINGPALLGGIGLLFGVQVVTARFVGAGHVDEAGAVWRRGVVIAISAGLVVCATVWTSGPLPLVAAGVTPDLADASAAVGAVLALSIPFHLVFIASTHWLEGLERPTPGAITMWVANAANLALNLALVPRWGAVGSAWATVLSRAVLATVLVAFVRCAPSLRTFHRARRSSPGAYRTLLTIGTPAASSALLEAGAFSAMGALAGRIDATAVATFSIATGGLVTLVYLLAQGLATAGAVLVSEALGAGAQAEARRMERRAFGTALVAMAVSAAACVVFARPIARAFASDAAIVAAFASNMGLVALLIVVDGGQGVTEALLRARGDNWFPTLARLVPFVSIAPPLAMHLSEGRGWGVTGVFAALVSASAIAFSALVARLVLRPR